MSRILIAEDDTGIAEFIARGLESAGYCCDVVDSGPVAFGMAFSTWVFPTWMALIFWSSCVP